MSTPPTGLLQRLWHGALAYAVKFGVVGAIGLVLDVAIFNYLRYAGVAPDGAWIQSALGAKIVSTSIAILFNWLGNRYWTFRAHRRKNYAREFIEYTIVSIGGMVIALGCLWVSHHLLGLNNPIADNISANVFGLGLGTIFRFVLYRFWVYGHHRSDGLANVSKVEEAQRTLFEEPTNTIPTIRTSAK